MPEKEKENIATLKMTSCKDCPFQSEERAHTADSFESEFNWFCGHDKKEKKKIAGSVGWTNSEQNSVKIPDWCPLLVKKINFSVSK